MQTIETGNAGVSVVSISGRLDTQSAAQVEAGLLQALATAKVVLDMQEVHFVSSAGLRVLLKAAKTAKSTSKGFAVCGLQPGVREVFEVSGFDRIIASHATRAEALASFMG